MAQAKSNPKIRTMSDVFVGLDQYVRTNDVRVWNYETHQCDRIIDIEHKGKQARISNHKKGWMIIYQSKGLIRVQYVKTLKQLRFRLKQILS